VPFTAGESVLELDAQWAVPTLEVIRAFEQPLIMAFNRGRLMVLPQAISKSTGLRHALYSLRISIHNTIGVGDAENDHDLLDSCEVGAAVAWGSPALRAVADEVIEGSGPTAVAGYIRRVIQQPRLSARQMGRRRLALGHEHNGEEVSLAVRGRTVLIAGEPGTGKSWVAGLLCEQAILQGYCICVIDPEGDYRSLEALPGVIMLGGDDPPPQAHELTRALRHPDVSVIVDLSKVALREKREYLHTLLPLLVALRRNTGLPHKILLDEAHYFLGGGDASQLVDPELAGYIFVTYRISALPAAVRQSDDAVVMVTRETDPDETRTLLGMCRPQPCVGVAPDVFRDLTMAEAALLPGAEEAHGRVRRFQLAPRLTTHVRHRSKYLDMPVLDAQAFVFTGNGRTPDDHSSPRGELQDGAVLCHDGVEAGQISGGMTKIRQPPTGHQQDHDSAATGLRYGLANRGIENAVDGDSSIVVKSKSRELHADSSAVDADFPQLAGTAPGLLGRKASN
jgi:hypothetical protein